jgi:hypothetical protein
VPFYQFLPQGFKRWVSRHFGFHRFPRGTYQRIDLITSKEYRQLFPEATCEGLRFPFSPIAETILAYYRRRTG